MIRDRVADEQGITCSVGVASTKFVAKLASTGAKPDGMLVVPADGVVAFLHPLPVGALWGVGERTEEELHRLGLRTVGDIAHTPLGTLVRALGEAAGDHLHAWPGVATSGRVVPAEREKSIGAEETFARDVDDPGRRPPASCCARRATGARMRPAGLAGRTVSHQDAVRRLHHDHPRRAPCASPPTWPRRSTRPPRACSTRSAWTGPGIRLVGVRVEGLVESEQAPPAAAREPRARLARGRAGGRPGPPGFGCGVGPAGQPRLKVTHPLPRGDRATYPEGQRTT